MTRLLWGKMARLFGIFICFKLVVSLQCYHLLNNSIFLGNWEKKMLFSKKQVFIEMWTEKNSRDWFFRLEKFLHFTWRLFAPGTPHILKNRLEDRSPCATPKHSRSGYLEEKLKQKVALKATFEFLGVNFQKAEHSRGPYSFLN